MLVIHLLQQTSEPIVMEIVSDLPGNRDLIDDFLEVLSTRLAHA
jgi:hypothetical protein